MIGLAEMREANQQFQALVAEHGDPSDEKTYTALALTLGVDPRVFEVLLESGTALGDAPVAAVAGFMVGFRMGQRA